MYMTTALAIGDPPLTAEAIERKRWAALYVLCAGGKVFYVDRYAPSGPPEAALAARYARMFPAYYDARLASRPLWKQLAALRAGADHV